MVFAGLAAFVTVLVAAFVTDFVALPGIVAKCLVLPSRYPVLDLVALQFVLGLIDLVLVAVGIVIVCFVACCALVLLQSTLLHCVSNFFGMDQLGKLHSRLGKNIYKLGMRFF